MTPINLKTVQQFRVEGMNINGVECTFTGGNLEELKQTVGRAFGGDVEFGPEDERGLFIFRRGDKTNPIGWIGNYVVPEAMSVTNNPRLQRVA
jgi:hypothetical protein